MSIKNTVVIFHPHKHLEHKILFNSPNLHPGVTSITRTVQSKRVFLRSGEVRGEPLLLVDAPLYPRRAHRRGGDPDTSAGKRGQLRGGADQDVHRLHRGDDPEVHHQHRPLQILIHHNVSCSGTFRLGPRPRSCPARFIHWFLNHTG